MCLRDIIQFQTSTTTEFPHGEVDSKFRTPKKMESSPIRSNQFIVSPTVLTAPRREKNGCFSAYLGLEEDVLAAESTLSPLRIILNTLEPYRKRFRNEFIADLPVIRPQLRPRYTLDELLAASDYSQAPSAEEREWID